MHVAAKFGSVDCLQALLEYSLCDTKKENKDNKRIDQVLCERKGDEQIKQQMKDCLQNRYYINLVKKVDISGCMSDILSIEVSFGKLLDRDFVIGETNRSGKQAKICAVAGPMTEASAKELKEKFKSPMNRSLNEIQVNLSDPNTGYVRIARNYCKANSFSWKEYWHFLDQIIDLASDRGLELLENHLKSQLNVCVFFYCYYLNQK